MAGQPGRLPAGRLKRVINERACRAVRPVQVAAAVAQPAHCVAIRAGGGDALVEHVVFVLLYTLLWLGSVRNPEKPNRRASGAEIL